MYAAGALTSHTPNLMLSKTGLQLPFVHGTSQATHAFQTEHPIFTLSASDGTY
jgi:hypothetical protein